VDPIDYLGGGLRRATPKTSISNPLLLSMGFPTPYSLLPTPSLTLYITAMRSLIAITFSNFVEI
ncbi:hypothetical protein, partial [Nostoc sp. CHAB 5715]|uniref:hypothetical protein n=1 Tax=Nostoc sp. CHAB 5715 TaxID=2780400 RepID=UPI001E4A9147